MPEASGSGVGLGLMVVTDEPDYSTFENRTGLAEDMKFLASMPELCDVTFLVGDTREPVCAVKAVLAARSRVFQKLLYQVPSPQRKKEQPPPGKLRFFLKRSSEPLLNLQNAAQQFITSAIINSRMKIEFLDFKYRFLDNSFLTSQENLSKRLLGFVYQNFRHHADVTGLPLGGQLLDGPFPSTPTILGDIDGTFLRSHNDTLGQLTASLDLSLNFRRYPR
ncbi:hypothetical protein PV326_002665 [Microctonus aethiopoides]|uniref:BTB domain-containing protein n=1 Tax=Microctonus aethiopoides TaxID=144406 RepID=A0AA39F9N4_9HYME|nr:hypothetical protein PV326_002665 [Microctonus aethiopoides]KAK0165524.1 hypothetical protein PV328_004031 [Microctonus aethiopoides]